jgi:predicted nucleic acid-binding protein
VGSYLIDTNVVIDYLNQKLPTEGTRFINQIIRKGFLLSVITKIELLSLRVPILDHPIIHGFVNDGHICLVTDDIVNETIKVRQLTNIKVADAIIAATALITQSTLITRNVRDFRGVPKLVTLNPWTLH